MQIEWIIELVLSDKEKEKNDPKTDANRETFNERNWNKFEKEKYNKKE
jgi:hypothetical protein